jgi:hypothetical protein
MMRVVVALAATALCTALISLPDPALARGGARGAMSAFRAPLIMHRSPRALLGHRPFARPHTFGHPHAHGTVRPATPFGTVRPARPFGTVGASTAFGTVAPLTRAGLVRRHHRAYHLGWSFPITIGGDAGYAGYIGTPYDPAETIPVYGPAPAAAAADPAAARLSGPREENADACRSERVTVPAAEGEREITVVRC